MSSVFFIGDMHFGHKRITEFTDDCGRKYRYGRDYKENMDIIAERWNERITKRDKVYVLGDVAFSDEGFDKLKTLNGNKILVRGNHDNFFSTKKWLEVFDEVEGIVRYKGYWLTHAPIHPDELRGKGNIHGHSHHNIMRLSDGSVDNRYLCVSCEVTDHYPVSIHEIQRGEYENGILSNFIERLRV